MRKTVELELDRAKYKTNCQHAKGGQKYACANNYTSASMVCITLDGIFVTRRGFHTLCLIQTAGMAVKVYL